MRLDLKALRVVMPTRRSTSELSGMLEEHSRWVEQTSPHSTSWQAVQLREWSTSRSSHGAATWPSFELPRNGRSRPGLQPSLRLKPLHIAGDADGRNASGI